MTHDPIVDEVRKIRDAHAKKFNYDIHTICRDLMARQKSSGLKFASFPPRRLKVEQPALSSAKPKAQSALRAKLTVNAPKRKRSA